MSLPSIRGAIPIKKRIFETNEDDIVQQMTELHINQENNNTSKISPKDCYVEPEIVPAKRTRFAGKKNKTKIKRKSVRKQRKQKKQRKTKKNRT